jgi:hypothetical protein
MLACVTICAVAVVRIEVDVSTIGSIYLILEMDQPYSGLIK